MKMEEKGDHQKTTYWRWTSMIIRVYGKNYKISQNLAVSTKTTIQKILENVKQESELRGYEKYYIAFIVMMYVVSSSILKELNTDNIKEIVNEIAKSEEDACGKS